MARVIETNVTEEDIRIESTLRPQTLDEFVGQKHLLGPGKVLRRIIEQDALSSMIFWGPPGVGKTQIMEQIAAETGVGLVAYTITHHTRQSAIGLPFIEKRTYGGEEVSVTEYTMSEIIASVYAKMEQTGADILVLDEPTKGMDAVFKSSLAAILRGWCAGGKTVILATHDLEFAGRYTDEVSFLFHSKIVSSAPRRQFFAALDIYTTALSALTGGRLVCEDDAEVAP